MSFSYFDDLGRLIRILIIEDSSSSSWFCQFPTRKTTKSDFSVIETEMGI